MVKKIVALLVALLAAPMAAQINPGRAALSRGLADTLYSPIGSPILATTCTNRFISAIAATGAGTCTAFVLAGAQFANQGTTTTLLHGAAAGNPSWAAVVSADLNITGTACTNQFLTAISSVAAGTCSTVTLAGAQFANQGTTTTVLHGNVAGNPSFAAVVDGDLSLTTPALGAPTATTVQTSGNGGFGAAPSITAGEMVVATDNFNGSTVIRSSNPDATDTSSIALLEAKASTGIVRLQAHGAGRTATRYGVTLANYAGAELTAGSGLLLGTTISAPIIMGTNGTRALTVDASSQAVSLRGTQTNDSATAGDRGELSTGTVAANATSLSTGTTVNVGTNTNITLTAGDWDCSGVVNFTFGATTSITNLAGGISTTTGTLPAQDSYFDYETSAMVPTGTAVATWVVPTVQISVAGSTSVFLVSQATFTLSTIKVGGTIRCRRMR